jgi:multimeric flavodoxin WrbA
MKIVALSGSARKGGNSNALLRLALESAAGRGAEVETFDTTRMTIAGCLGCDGCRRAPDAVCVQKDDMHPIYAAIKGCDALVVASPVYLYALSGWVKQALDRCYSLIRPDAPEGEEPWPRRVAPGKGFYLITAQAEDSLFYGYQILATVVYSMTWLGIERRGELIATGLDGPHDWEHRADLIEAARELIAV